MKNLSLLICFLSLLSCTKKKDDLTTFIRFTFDGKSYAFRYDLQNLTPPASPYNNYVGKSSSAIDADSICIKNQIISVKINGKIYSSTGYDDLTSQWIYTNIKFDMGLLGSGKLSDGNYYDKATFNGDLFEIKNGDTITGPPLAITNGSYMIKSN